MVDSNLAQQRADPLGWIGASLGGKYRIDALAGEGGFGVVYRATDLTLQEPVAVKFLKLGRGVDGPRVARLVDSFRTEAKILRRLSTATTGIVQAHAIDAATSPAGVWSAYLVLEWLDGRTLAAELDDRRGRGHGHGGRPLADAIALLESAVHALALAHEQGVVHRDLKPENLFLARTGGRTILKVLDFGVAKLMGEVGDSGGVTPASAAAATGIATRAFTAAYGAPEQFEPALGATGPWTDVYALALILLEVVTGRPPYVARSGEELRNEAVDLERRPSFSGLGVGVPDAVEHVMRRALAVDPRNRFPDANAFWTELRRAAGGAPVTSSRRLVTEPASTPRPGRSPRDVARPKRSAWGYGIVVALLALAAVGAIGLGRAVTTPPVPNSQPRVPPPEGMAFVPGGEYAMGSPSGNARNCEARRVAHVGPFFMDTTEVTVSEYRRCMSAGACSSTRAHALEQKPWGGLELCNELRAGEGQRIEDHPMNCVDRGQAAAYCAFVGKRLPTDDEWEAAARGRAGTEYPLGNAPPTCEQAIFGRPPTHLCPGRGTASVGSTPANGFGIFDLAGNVWEWTSSDCPTAAHVGTLRGGSFEFGPDSLRAWKHLPWGPKDGGVSTGFRCARDAR